MTREEMRRAIALDVIQQVAAAKFCAMSGKYCDVAPAVAVRRRKCEVCAIGAATVSSLRLYNEAPQSLIEDWDPGCGEGAFDHLEQFFPRHELDAMEAAFEM